MSAQVTRIYAVVNRSPPGNGSDFICITGQVCQALLLPDAKQKRLLY